MIRWFSKGLLPVVIVFLLFGWVNPVQGKDDYPNKPIDMIVPTTTGGSQDLSSRIVAAYLSKKWNVPINVINKPGGNSIPGSLVVQNAEPNGYTVLTVTSAGTSYQAAGIKDLPYDIFNRTYLGTMNIFPNIFVVPEKSPFKTLKDVIDDLKKDPGSFTWSSGGGVYTQDVLMRKVLKAVGINIKNTRAVLTQAGASPVVLAAGGNVKLGIGTTATSVPAIKGGLVRGVAITGEDRFSVVPDIPTFTEQGFPTIIADVWVGFSGPPKMPLEIVEKWEKSLREMVKDQEFLSKIKNIYAAPFYRDANQTREIIRMEYEEISKLWIQQ
jgi:tripartite-type tricarboxylate transporter receptor subunit TctC